MARPTSRTGAARISTHRVLPSRRSVLLLGAGVGAVGVLAACGDSGEGTESGEPTSVTMLVLGDKPTNGRLENMLVELNKILVAEANATLDLYYIEWADWQTQYNVQLLSGDDNVDLITTATDWLFAWDNAAKGAFLPLTEEMLQEHAPRTWEGVEAAGNWDVCRLNGQIMFIPEDNFTQWTNHGFFYRGDWATEAGLPNGEITTFEDFTTYFQWVKDNQPEAYPWDVAGSNEAAITGFMQGHTDYQTLQQITAGNFFPFHTRESDPNTVTSWYMESDELLQAAELAVQWNQIGVWREDVLNYDGDARELFYSGLSGADQHHTQTFVGGIWHNLSTRQPGSDPKFFWWGKENGNYFRDIRTHGAMAVSANSANPEKALQVYDIIRNNEEAYRLLNYGIEGVDYIITEDGKLGRPEGWDPATDGLGSNFWGGRMDEFEIPSETIYPEYEALYAELDSAAKDYPYETLIINQNSVSPYLAAMGSVLSEYIPQLQYGKFEDPAAAIEEMRQKLRDAGYEEALALIQTDLDTWAQS